MSETLEWRVEIKREYRDADTQYLYFATRDEALHTYGEVKSVFERGRDKANELPVISEFSDGHGGMIAVETRQIDGVRLTCVGVFERDAAARDLEHRRSIAAAGLTLRGDAFSGNGSPQAPAVEG